MLTFSRILASYSEMNAIGGRRARRDERVLSDRDLLFDVDEGRDLVWSKGGDVRVFAAIEQVGDGVVGVKGVVAVAAEERVAAPAAVEAVVVVSAGEDVVAVLAVELVGARAAVHVVVAAAAPETIASRDSGHRVVALAAVEPVVARAAGEGVARAVAVEPVVAAAAVDAVGSRAAGEGVVARSAVDRVATRAGLGARTRQPVAQGDLVVARARRQVHVADFVFREGCHAAVVLDGEHVTDDLYAKVVPLGRAPDQERAAYVRGKAQLERPEFRLVVDVAVRECDVARGHRRERE